MVVQQYVGHLLRERRERRILRPLGPQKRETTGLLWHATWISGLHSGQSKVNRMTDNNGDTKQYKNEETPTRSNYY